MRPPDRSRFPAAAKASAARRIALKATLYPCPEGGFTAVCPEIKGAVSQGETREEALENLFDAVKEIWAATAEMANEAMAGGIPKAKAGKRSPRPIKSKLAELCEAR